MHERLHRARPGQRGPWRAWCGFVDETGDSTLAYWGGEPPDTCVACREAEDRELDANLAVFREAHLSGRRVRCTECKAEVVEGDVFHAHGYAPVELHPDDGTRPPTPTRGVSGTPKQWVASFGGCPIVGLPCVPDDVQGARHWEATVPADWLRGGKVGEWSEAAEQQRIAAERARWHGYSDGDLRAEADKRLDMVVRTRGLYEAANAANDAACAEHQEVVTELKRRGRKL